MNNGDVTQGTAGFDIHVGSGQTVTGSVDTEAGPATYLASYPVSNSMLAMCKQVPSR